MAVNSVILAGKSTILAKNSPKPPIFGGFASEKVKNLEEKPPISFSVSFLSSAQGGGSKKLVSGADPPLPPPVHTYGNKVSL